MLLSREHEARIANNPDFVAFQGDVEALCGGAFCGVRSARVERSPIPEAGQAPR
jgi:hypothetical protein